MRTGKHRRLAVGAAVAGLAALVTVPASAAPTGATPPSAASTIGGFGDTNTALGPSWSSSADESVVGIGDSAGFHVLVARESDAFRWKNLVNLSVPALDEGPWTGELCTTGDGRYAVVVYAPSAAVNSPSLVEAGAFAAVVNLATGKTSALAAGVQLAYHTPSCGSGDHATLTRALGAEEQTTQVLDVNAAEGAVTSIRTVKAQITNVVPTTDGDDGVVDGSLVRIDADGRYTVLAKLPGEIYGAVATSSGVDLSTAAAKRGTISHWTGSKLENLGSGALGRIRLYPQAGGSDEVLGDTAGIKPGDSGLRVLVQSALPAAVSQHDDLLVESVQSAEIAAMTGTPLAGRGSANLEGRIAIAAVATRSGVKQSGTMTAGGTTFTGTAPDQVTSVPVPSQAAAPADYSLNRVGPGGAAVVKTKESELGTTGLLVQPAAFVPGGANPAPALDSEDDVDLSSVTNPQTPTCLVPRNSITDQVLQPNSNMVEWAVDQAVHGDLVVARPANYLQTGQASYSPQTMFPPVTLSDGGTIPAQVLLGIFAQESNFRQASPHAVAGNSGNPLISDYYGTSYLSGSADNPDVVPDYSHTDCGYGLGQVTDKMSTLDSSTYTTAQATAVATDYAANIAAAAQILATTWNQLAAQGTTENDGSSQYIENWFGTIWAYNSGVHPQSAASSNGGNYGLGWLNNPANPNYPADRAPFGDNQFTTNDAAHPQYWSYEEKVMGWIVHPQVSNVVPNAGDAEYSSPLWGSATDPFDHSISTVNIPENTGGGYDTFCAAQNSCTASSGCPADSSVCWWHGPVTWITTESTGNTTAEHLAFSLGSGEPAIAPAYATDCPSQSAFIGQFTSGTIIVNPLADPAQNTRGCGWSGNGGKFTIRLGDNMSLATNRAGAMQANALSAQIDLHQMGAGFLGYYYFTHAYDGTEVNTPSEGCVQVTQTSDGTGEQCTAFAPQIQVPTRIQNRVVGQWTPDISTNASGQAYLILAALPDGASASGLIYKIDAGMNANGSPYASSTCTVNQGTGSGDRWVELGVYELYPFADVRMSNMVVGASNSGAATNDVAFSSMLFEPVSSTYPATCGQIDTPNIN